MVEYRKYRKEEFKMRLLELQKKSTKVSTNFYLDIMNTITEGTIYDSNFKNYEKHFLGGREGVLTIIDVVNKDVDDKKIFPFIL